MKRDLASNKETGAFLISLFEPHERLILLAERAANRRKMHSRRVS